MENAQGRTMRKEHERVVALQFGGQKVVKLGARRIDLNDPYHLILTLSWPQFFILIVAVFVVINLVFGMAFWLVDGSIANARPGSFLDVFFFSIETLATVGYGVMAPATLYGHVVAAIEILIGMISLALITGLIFARFSKPTARILFSEHAVIREFDGATVLMLRVANERHNRIVEANASLAMVRKEILSDGEPYYRIHDLDLLRQYSPVFALTWTLIHRIDESSPLFGWSKESLVESGARITVSINGHDETIAASVHALHEYSADDLLFGHRFVDVISIGRDGERRIDLRRMHEVELMKPES